MFSVCGDGFEDVIFEWHDFFVDDKAVFHEPTFVVSGCAGAGETCDGLDGEGEDEDDARNHGGITLAVNEEV